MSATTTYQQQLQLMVDESGEIVRWLITIGVSIGALLEVIDSSIVNVALPHIQGNLGATISEAAWVITSYSIANAIILPLAAWLGDTFGRKDYFIFSLIGFVISSMACGFAPNLVVLVLSRVLQGLFGGGLLAKAQSILFETFPREKQGLVQAVFGLCVIVGPILGPTFGGWLTDNMNWRWIFFINLPIGIVSIAMCAMFLPPDLKTKKKTVVDWSGIFLLAMFLGSFQYVLEKGQDDDWFSSRTIILLSIAAVVGLILFIAQELTTEHPAVDLRVLRHPSVASGVTYSLVLGFALYGVSFLIPNYAQAMLGYTAFQAGILQVPGSIMTGFMMPFVGIFASKLDARYVVAAGTIILAMAMFQLSHITLASGWYDFFWPLILRGIGTVLMYLPLTLATVGGAPPKDITAVTAFFNLSRMLGGSIGIAMLTTCLTRRSDFHRVVLIEKVTPFAQDTMQRLNAMAGIFTNQGQSLHDARDTALHMMNGIVGEQSMLLSYEDICWLLGMLLICSVPLCLILSSGKRKLAEPLEMH
jgi:DHA2 family multidrug resistance protein